jgi:hypothetical protein
MMEEDRKSEIDSRLKQMDIAIEAFLMMADKPFFGGSEIRDAADKIRELRATQQQETK